MPRRILLALAAAVILAALTPVAHAKPSQVMTRDLARQMGLKPVRVTAAMKAAGAAGPLGTLAWDGPRSCDGWLVPSGLWKLEHCASPYFWESSANVQAHARLHVYRRDTISSPWQETGTSTLTINDYKIQLLSGGLVHSSGTDTDGTGVEDFYAPASGYPIGCGDGAFAGNRDESFRTPGGTAFYGPGAGTDPEHTLSPVSYRC